jgi:carbon monoxide dehydrogenase subunit G
MASIAKVVLSTASPAAVWDAVRDIGALHTRLVPGFVVATEIIPGGRRVTFANGVVIDEPIISSDDTARRLVWTARGATLQFTHYNGAVQVFPRDDGGSRVVWTADLLPNEMASAVDQMMDQGAAAMTRALAKL